VPLTRSKGVLGKEKDKAGLREMLHGRGRSGDLKREWYEVRLRHFAL
jgi:hypothetical protein